MKYLIVQIKKTFSTSKTFGHWLVLSCLFAFLIAHHNVHAAYHSLLQQPETLHQKLINKTPNLVIIDTRSPKKYLEGHITGAINLPITLLHDTIDGVIKRIVGPVQFQQVVERLGIKPSDHLVFYSGSDPLIAPRAFWTFEFYGHDSSSVLDGGYYGWIFKELPIEALPSILKPSLYAIEMKRQRFASKFDTLMAIQTNNTLLIDARPKSEFDGLTTRGQRLGHIPTAINLEFSEIFNEHLTDNGSSSFSTFINISEIKHKLSQLPHKKNIILYCNAGDEASALYFAFRLIGKDIALYDGSWAEWSADFTLPIINQITLKRQ